MSIISRRTNVAKLDSLIKKMFVEFDCDSSLQGLTTMVGEDDNFIVELSIRRKKGSLIGCSVVKDENNCTEIIDTKNYPKALVNFYCEVCQADMNIEVEDMATEMVGSKCIYCGRKVKSRFDLHKSE